MNYDGRNPEPPYECHNCAELVAELDNLKELAQAVLDQNQAAGEPMTRADQLLRKALEGKPC